MGKYTFIDKEFISKYEALKESLKDDLFLIMEIEVSGVTQDVVIQIEHKSNREDVSERIYEYLCYAWLLRRKPVWSIVIYTDKAVWRKPIPDTFWYAFSSKHKKQYCHFDVIKVNSEKSGDLIKEHSLMCKLLALKAGDSDVGSKALIYEIYKYLEDMKNKLTNEEKLLAEQWVQAYKKVPEKTVEKIKQEVNMSFSATTITEHYVNVGWNKGKIEGKIEGEIEGKIKGEIEGKIKGKIENLEELYRFSFLSKEQMEKMIEPLKAQLQNLQSSEKSALEGLIQIPCSSNSANESSLTPS